MAGKAVAEREAPQVPALRPTPALEIEAQDIALPRIYIGQYMSKAVQEQIVKAGAIYTATGQDDPNPNVLWNQGDEGGVVFYVLSLRKGKSIQDNGELVLFDYDDPNAPPDAWVTYNYAVAVPSVDEDVPFKLLLTRTGTPAARNINLILKKNAARNPAWATAFSLTAAPRENAKGKFFVARVQQVEANANDVATAESLALMVAAAPIEAQATEQPAI